MTKVSQWMTRNPVTIEKKASIIEAMHLMKGKAVRHLPVTWKGRFCGLITDRMIKEFTPGKTTTMDAWEMHYLLSKCTVQDAMNPKPLTIAPDAPLCEAARIAQANRLGSLCVIDEQGGLVGILTTINFMEALIEICSTADNPAFKAD